MRRFSVCANNYQLFAQFLSSNIFIINYHAKVFTTIGVSHRDDECTCGNYSRTP